MLNVANLQPDMFALHFVSDDLSDTDSCASVPVKSGRLCLGLSIH